MIVYLVYLRNSKEVNCYRRRRSERERSNKDEGFSSRVKFCKVIEVIVGFYCEWDKNYGRRGELGVEESYYLIYDLFFKIY